MGDSLNLIVTNYHPRTRVLDQEFLQDVDYERVQDIYRQRFYNGGDFFFIIVGNMEEEDVKLLAQKYIGNIPAGPQLENWIDRKIYEPEGMVEKVIPLSLEIPKASVNIIINQEMEYTPYNLMVMRVIEGILDLRYMETIREEEGGTYGVGIRTSLNKWPLEKATMQINFDCDPERAGELKDKVFAELENLATKGPSREDLSKTRENILKDRQEAKEHNSYYLSTLFTYYLYGVNFDDPANYEDIVNGLKTEDVQKVMRDFYDAPNMVDVIFVPETAVTE